MSWLPGWLCAPGWVLRPLDLLLPISHLWMFPSSDTSLPQFLSCAPCFFFSASTDPVNLSPPSRPPANSNSSGETPPTGHWNRCVHQLSLTTTYPALHGAATQHQPRRAPHVLRLSITGPEPTGTLFSSTITQHASLKLSFSSSSFSTFSSVQNC